MIEKVQRVAMLFDFYGRLLTEKQQEILSLYYDQDLSLSEIAEEYQVSRQAVHDILRRAEKILEGYEDKLGLVRKFVSERQKIGQVLDLLDNAADDPTVLVEIKLIINEIVDIQED